MKVRTRAARTQKKWDVHVCGRGYTIAGAVHIADDVRLLKQERDGVAAWKGQRSALQYHTRKLEAILRIVARGRGVGAVRVEEERLVEDRAEGMRR